MAKGIVLPGRTKFFSVWVPGASQPTSKTLADSSDLCPADAHSLLLAGSLIAAQHRRFSERMSPPELSVITPRLCIRAVAAPSANPNFQED